METSRTLTAIIRHWKEEEKEWASEDYGYLTLPFDVEQVCRELDEDYEKLEAENARLREALEEIAESENYVDKESNLWEEHPSLSAYDAWEIAKQALQETE